MFRLARYLASDSFYDIELLIRFASGDFDFHRNPQNAGKAEGSVFEQQLSIRPRITKVKFLQLPMAHSTCKGSPRHRRGYQLFSPVVQSLCKTKMEKNEEA